MRAAIATTLPGYMMPSSLTVLDVLPKTESGKLNRPGLPLPAVSTGGLTEPARTDTERALAKVFAELLSTPKWGASTTSSPLAATASCPCSWPRGRVGLAVSPRMIFENPTVQQLAAAVDALGNGQADTERDDQAADVRFEPMSTSGLSSTDLAAVTQLWSSSREGTT